MEKIKPLSCIAKVIENRFITPSVFILKFETEPKVKHRAGQFASIVIPGAGPNGRDLRRAYSIASPPEFEHLELCIKRVDGGPGTSFLSDLKEGSTFKLNVPFGDFVYDTEPTRQCVFIATGTGIAPFRAMMRSDEFKAKPPRAVFCLFGVRDEEEILYTDEIKSVPGIHFANCISKLKNLKNIDAPCFSGRVSDYLKNQLGSNFAWKESDYYLCGNGLMIKEVTDHLLAQGVEKDAILTEKYY